MKRHAVFAVPMFLAGVAAGCDSGPAPDYPAMSGRRVQVVDLFGDRGRVQGFAEWGRSGEAPKTYAVGGWARQRAVEGQIVTVFDLALNALDHREARRATRNPAEREPVDVRVVVNEGSGHVTLTRRR